MKLRSDALTQTTARAQRKRAKVRPGLARPAAERMARASLPQSCGAVFLSLARPFGVVESTKTLTVCGHA